MTANLVFPFNFGLEFWPFTTLHYTTADLDAITIVTEADGSYGFIMNNVMYVVLFACLWAGAVTVLGSPLILVFILAIAGVLAWKWILTAPQQLFSWFFGKARVYLFFLPWALLIQGWNKPGSWAQIFN